MKLNIWPYVFHDKSVAPAATAVFRKVLTEGPLSRVGLARRLDLSSAAVTRPPAP
jgi:hypothetical protein